MKDVPREPTPDLRSDPDVPGDIRYDADLAVHEPAEIPGEPSEPSRRRSPLLLFPLGLLLLAIAVYILFGLIANEGRTPSDYLNEIRMRGADAWEPAFQLSRLLAEQDAKGLDPRFVTDLVTMFESSRDEDPRVRRYLALSLPPLRALLHDPVEDVAWNAALSLARRGDRSGLPLLHRMLDRTYLDGVQRADESGRPRALTEEQKEDAIKNALRSLVLLGDTAALDDIRRLRDDDPNLRVRQEAFGSIEALLKAGQR